MCIKMLYCSLCCTPSSSYKSLQNELGDSNYAYEITVKYFDPMLITGVGNSNPQENRILCQSCWVHIKEFHEFQQNVINARTMFEKNEIKQPPITIKSENEIDLENTSANISNNEIYENGEDLKIIKNDVKLFDEALSSSNDEDDEDDEKPLITWKSRKIKNLLETRDDYNNERMDAKLQKVKKNKILAHNKKASSNENKTQRKKAGQDGNNIVKSCNSKFNLKKARESDDFIREWKPILECDLCEETTSSFDKLRSHFRNNHKSRFYIKCCERKFYRRYVLVNHIQLHLNPNTYKCEICGKVSANKNNLKLHKKLMHEENKQLECDICHKLFNLKTSLDRHLLTHVTGDKDFICQDCGKAYVLEVQLKSHIRTVHNVDRVCDQCGKTVHGIQALKKHLMEHAGIAKPKFPCDECGVKLNSRNSLKRHKAAYHHDGSTIYVCSICAKVAASESALLNHKKYVHEEERKHKCTYCDKAFKRPKNLLEHIATHTGQDLYQCPHCPQTFKVSANMHHHRKKAHPVEWEEGRKNRLQIPKIDINHVKNQVVL